MPFGAAPRYYTSMNAEPLLKLVAGLLAKHRLEAVLIGNAAAALQGSPLTTLDLDFMFRKTPPNLGKLKRLADDLDAVVLRRIIRPRGCIASFGTATGCNWIS